MDGCRSIAPSTPLMLKKTKTMCAPFEKKRPVGDGVFNSRGPLAAFRPRAYQLRTRPSACRSDGLSIALRQVSATEPRASSAYADCSFLCVYISSVHMWSGRKFFGCKGCSTAMPKLHDAVASGLSERLRTIRKRAGLSQDELAARASLARPNLASVEQGRRANLRLSTLSRLAEVLGVDVVDFFCDRSVDEQQPVGEDATARVIANVKRLRSEAGLSQEALSVKAHRFRTYVGRLENEAASPMVVDLQDLADALGSQIPVLLEPSPSKRG
ncbi:DNA-binding protein [Burkholderia pseudomallei]|nr:DNA-binding protein [Burkholderia pseudomallei]